MAEACQARGLRAGGMRGGVVSKMMTTRRLRYRVHPPPSVSMMRLTQRSITGLSGGSNCAQPKT